MRRVVYPVGYQIPILLLFLNEDDGEDREDVRERPTLTLVVSFSTRSCFNKYRQLFFAGNSATPSPLFHPPSTRFMQFPNSLDGVLFSVRISSVDTIFALPA